MLFFTTPKENGTVWAESARNTLNFSKVLYIFRERWTEYLRMKWIKWKATLWTWNLFHFYTNRYMISSGIRLAISPKLFHQLFVFKASTFRWSLNFVAARECSLAAINQQLHNSSNRFRPNIFSKLVFTYCSEYYWAFSWYTLATVYDISQSPGAHDNPFESRNGTELD